jgi:uncharacterized protein (UPF0276 family)
VLAGRSRSPWFEAISENFLGLRGQEGAGRPLNILEKVRERVPVVLHGVSLSIASVDELDMDYLARLKALAERVQPAWLSDHLCWTGVHGHSLHDLMPIPYTREALDHVAARVCRVQDFLGRPFVLENVSSYVSFRHSEMSEWEFLAELTRRTGCRLLLDVNNVFVSAFNHGFDPGEFLEGIPRGSVAQFHLAGHSERDGLLVDTHDHDVPEGVWELYRWAVRRFGAVSTLIERDDAIPSLAELEAEAERAASVQAEALAESRTAEERA